MRSRLFKLTGMRTSGRSLSAAPGVRYKRVRHLFLLLAALAGFGVPQARADEAATSPWARHEQASVRLLAGPTAPSGKQKVGVEILLAPGWKTYWRSPGDSGVPPSFDWTGSTNVGGLDVRWPVPERFEDGAGSAIGYVGEVVIPISVQPVEAEKPVWLVLKLDFAVCDKICVPVSAEARLWLEPGVTDVRSPRLEQFEQRVPRPVQIGQSGQRIDVLSARPEAIGQKAGLRISLQPPADGRIEDVFVEGAGMWTFGKPVLTPEPDGKVSALIKIHDRPKGAAGPVPLIVTVRGTPSPVETRLDLDIPAAKP
jgi:suppressor for copper-sensitivity B